MEYSYPAKMENPLGDVYTYRSVKQYPWGRDKWGSGSVDPGYSLSEDFPLQDRCGLTTLYLKKLPFEDDDHIDDSAYYGPGEEIKPNTHQLVKKFLKQVRESGGYDVDCRPPDLLNSPFAPIALGEAKVFGPKLYETLIQATEFAIREINDETMRNYKLVKLEKAVYTAALWRLLTFTAKEADADVPQTFRAMVFVPAGGGMTLAEWRTKPIPAAAATSSGA